MISYNQNFVKLWDIPSDVAESRSNQLALQSSSDKVADPGSFLQLIEHLIEHREEKSRDEIRLKDGRVIDRFSAPMFGSEGHYYGRVWYFRDITSRKHFEEDLTRSYQKTKKILSDAINTMAKILEMRDPYTAGHQHRVAELTTAIAREIGWGDDHIEQLRMAAAIHDIGKINVPSDLLSKPGRLNVTEFNLIKTHAQGGYEIVKNMEFPPSVAQAILQHHERLDGSGYPNGLKGDSISQEARVISVADVVEAMASHRPYRPALGLDAALAEIAAGSVKLFDPEVVDSCLRLFREKGFKFEQ
jgi:putative nucleotidyltransferase with HDIG domain